MTFSTSACLQKATSRAKSDVANKLVSMFLHDLSRRIATSIRLPVSDPRYADSVAAAFGSNCCYCSRVLEKDRAAVEHLDGMNRFRLGLHIPGNVLVACKRCNGEKRRDDQASDLTLAESGWESFLSHDGSRCLSSCSNCAYWATVWPDAKERAERLETTKARINAFRNAYPGSMGWARKARACLRPTVDSLYRECQEFAVTQIRNTANEAFSKLLEVGDK